MSTASLVWQTDEYWDEYQDEIQFKEEQDIIKLGYVLGRWMDVDLVFEEDEEGNVIVGCKQSLNLENVFMDVLKFFV